MRNRAFLAAFCCVLALAGMSAGTPASAADAPAAAAVPGPGPQELMQQVSTSLLKDLDAGRETYRKDPKKLRALVDRHLLAYFDVEYSARMVLGKNWRTSNDDQHRRFIDAFYQSLLRNYGNAMLDFTADRLVILPFKGEPGATTATIRTEVKKDDGTLVPVNYSLRATPQGWKAWDVTIEGISYVKNYRTDFGAEIDQKGIEAVIKRLEAQNAAGKPDAAAPAAKPGKS
jgi:phospholipid transport system substrate-binding protein